MGFCRARLPLNRLGEAARLPSGYPEQEEREKATSQMGLIPTLATKRRVGDPLPDLLLSCVPNPAGSLPRNIFGKGEG